MLLKINRQQPLFFLLLILLSFAMQAVSAQNQTDTTKKILLASLDKKDEARYMIKKSNVVFPEILKGNEDEMLPYIEKFCSNRRDYLIRMYTKGKSFFPKTTSILKKYDLPAELKILLTLESAYNGKRGFKSRCSGLLANNG